MMEEKETLTFEGWAIVELFGHNQIAGYVTDTPQFGTSMMRVDVPEFGDNPGYTKFFGGSAIYAITPTTEEIARMAAARLDVRPVANWVVPDRPKLPQKTEYPGDDYDKDDYIYDEDEQIEF